MKATISTMSATKERANNQKCDKASTQRRSRRNFLDAVLLAWLLYLIHPLPNDAPATRATRPPVDNFPRWGPESSGRRTKGEYDERRFKRSLRRLSLSMIRTSRLMPFFAWLSCGVDQDRTGLGKAVCCAL